MKLLGSFGRFPATAFVPTEMRALCCLQLEAHALELQLQRDEAIEQAIRNSEVARVSCVEGQCVHRRVRVLDAHMAYCLFRSPCTRALSEMSSDLCTRYVSL